MNDNHCKHCGSMNLIVTPKPRTGGKLTCADCGQYIKFLPVPMTPERARDFVMPYGKHHDKTLAAIAREADGLRYLHWGVETFDNGTVKRAIAAFLKELETATP